MTENPPAVTIGMPVRDGMPHLPEALASLLTQDFTDFEIVVCDNCSSDGSAELVGDLAQKDARIRYVRNDTNIGGTRNFNRTVELARGRYFKWAACDDTVSSSMVSRCVEALERAPSAVLAYPTTRLVDSEGEPLQIFDDGARWGAVSRLERFRCSLDHWTRVNLLYGVIRRDVLRRTKLLGNFPGSDYALQADLALRGPFVHVPEAVLYRRIHDRGTRGLTDVALAQFFEPERTTRFETKTLRILLDHVHLVLRSETSAIERLRMLAMLGRQVIVRHKRLYRECSGATMRGLRGVRDRVIRGAASD